MKWLNQDGMVRLRALALVLLLGVGGVFARPPRSRPEPIMLVVMDPLAKELACACVRGYGQRDYHQLALHLGKALGQRVLVSFSDNLEQSLEKTGSEQEILIIGQQSIIEHDSGQAKFKYRPLCR